MEKGAKIKTETKVEKKKEQKQQKSGEVTAKKPKSSRNTEKRRERSKVAARCRRGKESEIFTELSLSLPVSESSRANLDKASVMRLTLCDLKLKEMIESMDGLPSVEGPLKIEKDEASYESLTNSAVSGFVLVCSLDGDVIYVSEGIATCLGLSQYEVMGQSLLEYSHPCDHADVKEMLVSSTSNKSSNLSSSSVIESKSALFRMKSANSSRGRNVHHRSTNYKVVSCFGRLFSGDVGIASGSADQTKKWFVGICEPLLHPSDVDIPLNKQTFLSKHSPDMKFEYIDESISEFMGYKPDDLVGKSLFDFYHACDGDGITRSFKSLYTKGQTVTDRTRFLAKGGGWIWVLTQATTINNNAGKPTSVVCIHFVASGVECEDEIVSHVQLRGENEPVIPIRKPVIVTAPAAPVVQPVEKKQPLQETTNLQQKTIATSTIVAVPVVPEEIVTEPLIKNPFTGPILSKPTPSTAKIFAPRTEDMDTGFLMPVNDTLIVTKEEPEDLTHLAPIAGDECVPLSNVPLLDDLLQWLDAADMEYQVLEGYEEPLPLPLISAAVCGSMIDSPIPIPFSLTSTASEICSLVKDDVVMDVMSVGSDSSCGSPLLLRSTDPTLLSSTDPLLLSPFKSPSPEPILSTASSPAPSCRMDFMSSDIFSTFYSDNHVGQSGGGGTAGASSHKSKAGGGYDDDSFSGFPMVSDFQANLFSPGSCFDDVGPSASPPHLINIIDGSTGGLGTLKIDVGISSGSGPLKIDGSTTTAGLGSLKINEGASGLAPFKIEGGCSNPTKQPSVSPFGLLTTKQPDANVGLLKYVVSGSPNPGKNNAGPMPPEMEEEERPLPSKIAKRNYTDEQGNTKPWLEVAGLTPTQPPWKAIETQTLPVVQVEQQQSFKKRSTISTTTGTQTLINLETNVDNAQQRRHQIMQQRQRQLQKYRQLLMNPVVLQALLLNRKLMTAASNSTATQNSRKRNFVGKLLSNGGLLSNRFALGESDRTGVGVTGTANLPGAGFLELPSALVELTNQDCEVNAPLTQPLLDGPDLLTALDTELPLVGGTDCM